MKSRIYPDVAVAVPVTVPYVKKTDHGAAWFIGAALSALVEQAGIQKEDIDGLALASYTNRPDSAAVMAEYFGMELGWLVDLPMGGASGALALRRAARAVQSGEAEMVACIGADVMQMENFKNLIADFSGFSRDYVHPYGATGPTAIFAMITQNYMHQYGATREDFAKICIAQRQAAMHNPNALLRKPMTLEDYLNARMIADPLSMLDCVMPCCGAEAFLVMRADRAQKLGLPFTRLLASAERHNGFYNDDIQFRGGWARFSEALYNDAELGPQDMDFLQAYDDYPVIALMQIEDLGFCKKGEGPELLRTKSLSAEGGALPLNTGGGQLSVGQAGAAGGFLGINEAVRQLLHQAPGLQIPQARCGIVSGYGYVNYDRGLCATAAILSNSGN